MKLEFVAIEAAEVRRVIHDFRHEQARISSVECRMAASVSALHEVPDASAGLDHGTFAERERSRVRDAHLDATAPPGKRGSVPSSV